MFALVLPDFGDAAVDRLYTYAIPAHLRAGVCVGGRVLVPFGARQVAGHVLGICERAEVADGLLKEILAVKSAEPTFSAEQAVLAQWIAATYLCPLSEALRPFLVEPGSGAAKRRWQCTDAQAVTTLLPDPTLNAVLDHIRAHPGAAGGSIRAIFGENGFSALDALRRDGLIRPVATRGMKERSISAVMPNLAPTELLAQADALPARAAKQGQLLRWAAHFTAWDEPLTIPEVARRAEVGDGVVRTCIEKGWLRTENVTLRRNPWENVTGRKASPPALTATQQAAVRRIEEAVSARAARSFLLYGVTGSGKTEVFLHAIAHALSLGRQAIVLVPEISLTAQAMALYHGRFPGQVAVLHSHLSAGERYDEWQRIAGGEARVILGARSAIFAPCADLGLIIIDEEHETSYKQESSPRYHAKAVALERARLNCAPVVLASATPSLETMREAEIGKHVLLKLPERIESRPLPTVKLVDLRRMTTNARVLSHPMREAITARLSRGEQTILFLNRRGYSYVLLCTKCGHQATCPHCTIPLTFHKQSFLLRCHHCDFTQRAHAACPECKGEQIAYKGVGTERLEEEVQTLWPVARIGRMDRDTTARKGAHQAILDKFDREELDILIGTQMVAKGLDFPRVTLVGVITADSSLAIPDFRAPERTFQLLTQVAGRAGRSEWPGEVIVQTFNPDHYSIRAAMTHDYDTFYRKELLARGESDACWPPLTALINIVVSGENDAETRATAAALARRAREQAGGTGITLPPMPEASTLPGMLEFIVEDREEPEEDAFLAADLLQREVPSSVIVDGPTPCPLPRLRGRFRYHIILRGQDRPALRKVAGELRDITPPKGVYANTDIDPLSLA